MVCLDKGGFMQGSESNRYPRNAHVKFQDIAPQSMAITAHYEEYEDRSGHLEDKVIGVWTWIEAGQVVKKA
jgi:hypothetical protein